MIWRTRRGWAHQCGSWTVFFPPVVLTVVAPDGPFAETKEQLGGFYLIESEDLNEAIAIAKGVPVLLDGAIEIRPLLGG